MQVYVILHIHKCICVYIIIILIILIYYKFGDKKNLIKDRSGMREQAY